MKVCFIVEAPAHFPEMFETACALSQSFKVSPQIVAKAGLLEERELANEFGISWVEFQCSSSKNKLQAVIERRSKSFLWLKKYFIYSWLQRIYIRYFISQTSILYIWRHVSWLLTQIKKAEKLIGEIRAEVLILPCVNFYDFSGAILIAARRKNIPVLLIPYAWLTKKEDYTALLSGSSDQSLGGLLARLISMIWPQWVYGDLLYMSPVKIFAARIVGVPQSNPWRAEGECDLILVDSTAMKKAYINDGIEADKCLVVGSASQDLLYRYAHELPDDVPPQFFLVFIPPDQTGNNIPGFEFLDYWEMVLYWVDACLAVSGEFIPVFSIHPRMRGHLDNKLKTARPNLNIYQKNPCNLIPHAAFCVSELSGIMRIVLASGKPLIYFDVFKYGSVDHDFLFSPLTVHAKNTKSFENHLQYFSNSKTLQYYGDTVKQSEPDWGLIDGKAGDRILELLNNLRINNPNSD